MAKVLYTGNFTGSCFNCEATGHSATSCPHPADKSKIDKARKAYFDKRDGTSGHRHFDKKNATSDRRPGHKVGSRGGREATGAKWKATKAAHEKYKATQHAKDVLWMKHIDEMEQADERDAALTKHVNFTQSPAEVLSVADAATYHLPDRLRSDFGKEADHR